MIISGQIHKDQIAEMLSFYKKHFDSVELVKCTECDSELAFECAGGAGMGMAQNELGKYVIPIGDQLMAHRVRLDQNEDGERMVGYQCACGNDSKLSAVEREVVPVGKTLVHLTPFEKHRIMEQIKQDPEYRPNFRRVGNKKIMDGFSIERV